MLITNAVCNVGRYSVSGRGVDCKSTAFWLGVVRLPHAPHSIHASDVNKNKKNINTKIKKRFLSSNLADYSILV